MIGVLYEHPHWFVPLFAELERRGLGYERILADSLRYDPAEKVSPYSLVFNRMSPSAYLRGHTRAIFATRSYLAHLERLGIPVINGSAAYRLELSKAAQLDLLAAIGLPAPATRVVNDLSQIESAAGGLTFPLIVKPNVGGSGALMQRIQSADELADALHSRGGAPGLDDVFGIDGTALVQEYHPPRGGSIVRAEVLDGKLLYAIRIHNDPDQGFNLCPADICQTPEPVGADASFDFCPADLEVPARASRKIEAVEPPEWVQHAVLRICETAGLDLGGVEYLESERDGRVYFYDINALSNFVTDAPKLVGFDPFIRLGEYVERRWRAATGAPTRIIRDAAPALR
jgi:glutathione synthase/RimK-type ligase-like ATP-grasp enzyme